MTLRQRRIKNKLVRKPQKNFNHNISKAQRIPATGFRGRSYMKVKICQTSQLSLWYYCLVMFSGKNICSLFLLIAFRQFVENKEVNLMASRKCTV